MQLSLLVLLASVFFSGFVLADRPVHATRCAPLAYALPVTHGIQLLQDLMLRGTDERPVAGRRARRDRRGDAGRGLDPAAPQYANGLAALAALPRHCNARHRGGRDAVASVLPPWDQRLPAWRSPMTDERTYEYPGTHADDDEATDDARDAVDREPQPRPTRTNRTRCCAKEPTHPTPRTSRILTSSCESERQRDVASVRRGLRPLRLARPAAPR